MSYFEILQWLQARQNVEDASTRPILSATCVGTSQQFISSSPAAFLFLVFLSTESSSSRVNDPSLMFYCLPIILVIGLCVTFAGFPSRFSKCCFQFYSFLLVYGLQFSFCSLRLSLPGYPRLPIFPWVSNLIYLILYVYVCSFRHMLANSFRAFFSFRAFVFVGLLQLHLEAVFTSARFSLTANVSQGTLDLVLGFVGMYFATASRYALTKFSYSSFGVSISVFFL